MADNTKQFKEPDLYALEEFLWICKSLHENSSVWKHHGKILIEAALINLF